MTASPTQKSPSTSLARDWLYAARYYLGGRRTLLVGAVIVVAAGIALNWNWLVAAGIAPLIIGFLPCAAMCALGLCMHGKHGGHGKSDGSEADPDER